MPEYSANRDQEVTIQEQGELTLDQEAITSPSNGNNMTTFTVPTGKKWILKFAECGGAGTWSATVNYHSIRISDGTLTFNYIKHTGDTQLIYEQFGSHNIILPEGWTIDLLTNISDYSTGSINHRLAYVELDS
jgi:hypothetical protein